MLDIVRTEQEYEQILGDALTAELARARAGEIDAVSAKAAARYLGIHHDTLGEWRRASPPKGPRFRKGPDGIGRANEHVSYLYADLIEWQEARSGKTAKERKLIDELDKLRQRERELKAELALQEARDRVAKLARKVGRKLSFNALADLTAPEDWVADGHCITGHVLTVDDATLASALAEQRIVSASLEEVLALPWANEEEREPFVSAFDEVVTTVRERIREAQFQIGVVEIKLRREALGEETPTVEKPSRRSDKGL